MQILPLLAQRVERSKSPHALEPTEARILNGVDLSFLFGIVRRQLGFARTQVAASANTITSCFVAQRYDGKRIVLDGNNAGAIGATVGDGTLNGGAAPYMPIGAGPLNEWTDADAFPGGQYAENFTVDDGIEFAGS